MTQTYLIKCNDSILDHAVQIHKLDEARIYVAKERLVQTTFGNAKVPF
jgi:hypothetical protein